MAKIIPSPLISEITGSIGGVTFKRANGIISVGSRVTKQPPPSALQIAVRNSNAFLRRGWAALNSSQQDSWNQLSLQLQGASFGNGKYPRRGYDLFLDYNWSRSVFFEPLVSVSPNNYMVTLQQAANPMRGAMTSVPFIFVANIFTDPTTDVRVFVWCRMGQRGARKSALSPWKLIWFTNILGPIFDITTNFQAHFQDPQVSQAYQFKFTFQCGTAFPGHSIGENLVVLA